MPDRSRAPHPHPSSSSSSSAAASLDDLSVPLRPDAMKHSRIDDYDIHDRTPPLQPRRNWLFLGLSATTCALFIIMVVLAAYVNKYKQDLDNINNGPSGDQRALYEQIRQEIFSTRDTSVDPCDDFYQYACGGWLNKTLLPSDRTRYSKSFTAIDENNLAVLHQIAEEDWPVIGPFYRSCMDTSTIDLLDRQPVQPYLDQLANATTTADLFTYAANILKKVGASAFWGIDVVSDSKIPENHILDVGQGGLTFRALGYYSTGNDSKTQDLTDHITNVFKALGDPDQLANANAKRVVAFEITIASFTLPPDQLRDPEATYNKKKWTEFLAMGPKLDWPSYLSALDLPTGASKPDDWIILVDTPYFFSNMSNLIETTEFETIRQYLRWKTIYTASSDLSKTYVDLSFAFFSQKINGQKEPTPRWKKCVKKVDALMGEIIGRYWVQKSFPGASKDVSIELIQMIKTAFKDNLPNLDWMDAATRALAETKLSLVTDLVGYPTNWTDYSKVGSLQSKTYYQNLQSIYTWDWGQTVEKLSKPVDKNEWQMTPPTVNAYYDPTLNSINFPAGIIQPPFFNVSYPPAMNFGGIGMVMGHELTHGFDDQGRQYDGTGRLTPWWSPASVEKFQIKADCISAQYSGFVNKQLNKHVNGDLTLGENIADNGGIREAFRAFKAYESLKGAAAQIDPSITNDQLYFIAYAQDWCTLNTDADAFQLLETDPHSPAFARVNGPLQNYDEFAKAFGCKAGTYMNPPTEQKCLLW